MFFPHLIMHWHIVFEICPHPQADIDVFPELWIKETEEELDERHTDQASF